MIEIAGTLVKTGRQTILKITEGTARRLDLGELFRQVADPPRFAWS